MFPILPNICACPLYSLSDTFHRCEKLLFQLGHTFGRPVVFRSRTSLPAAS